MRVFVLWFDVIDPEGEVATGDTPHLAILRRVYPGEDIIPAAVLLSDGEFQMLRSLVEKEKEKEKGWDLDPAQT